MMKDCIENAYVDKPCVGKIWNVCVTKVDTFIYFHVQNVVHNEYIYDMFSTPDIFDKNDSSNLKKKKTVCIGNVIAAPYEDGLWYRVKKKK